uniref:Secreted protein n=1 Tax=Macrostomum lignano TaxID=282301 RepID=A0A1I8HW84_9PLAT
MCADCCREAAAVAAKAVREVAAGAVRPDQSTVGDNRRTNRTPAMTTQSTMTRGGWRSQSPIAEKTPSFAAAQLKSSSMQPKEAARAPRPGTLSQL